MRPEKQPKENIDTGKGELGGKLMQNVCFVKSMQNFCLHYTKSVL
jgi:hypothetical protein